MFPTTLVFSYNTTETQEIQTKHKSAFQVFSAVYRDITNTALFDPTNSLQSTPTQDQLSPPSHTAPDINYPWPMREQEHWPTPSEEYPHSTCSPRRRQFTIFPRIRILRIKTVIKRRDWNFIVFADTIKGVAYNCRWRCCYFSACTQSSTFLWRYN